MLPLSGLRVLCLEQYGAGPFGSSHLANLGAEVIKIENPTSPDVSRTSGPYFLEDEDASSASLYFQSLNLNKKSVTLDLTTDAGRRVFHRLVADADAVFHNMRGDVPGKLGVNYADLAPANPKIVCAHVTAYGREGERASWPGYDYIMQAQAGYCSLTGDPGSPPTRFGLSIIDWMSGLSAALGLVSGVMGARTTGIGGDIDVSLFDVALYNLGYVGVWELNTDHRQGKVPRGGHPASTPAQMFKTRDGWIYIMAGSKDKHWRILCEIIGRKALIEDPRFLTVADRADNRDALTGLIDDALAARTTAEWMALMGSRIPAGPVLSVAEALANPYVAARGAVQTARLGSGGDVKAIRNPVRWSGGAPDLVGAPRLGEHTVEVLQAAGFTLAEIDKHRADGVI
jgi:crotonobetainyl-CoA:carnitine CoA-transferase CaiB-like acyl-CoA transferase